MSHANWAETVIEYVGEVIATTESVEKTLDESRVATGEMECDTINQSTAKLETLVHHLQALVMRREEILQHPEAPKSGSTIAEKLLSTRRIEDARLAKQCDDAREKLMSTHDRATALFVCQYHLADLTGDISAILMRDSRTSTYDKSGIVDRRGPAGGGLIDEAA
ncbi:MAG: hypothetical protein AAF664_08030 [Planctomycetota bacterium]